MVQGFWTVGTANGKKIREFRMLAKEQIKGWPTGVWAGRGGGASAQIVEDCGK